MTVGGMDFTIALLLAMLTFGHCTLPDYIKVCQRSDPKLAECIKNSIEVLREHLTTGIPEIGVPALEPLALPFVDFNSTSEGTHLAVNISNVDVYGPSSFKLLRVVPTATKSGYTFRIEAVVPQVFLTGDYGIDGRILLLQLQGKGPIKINATNYHFDCLLRGHRVKKDNVKHLEFEKMQCTLEIGSIKIHLENLFNGNPVLGKATNDVINDNAQAFFEEFKPAFLDALTQRFTDISNQITSHFTYDELFP